MDWSVGSSDRAFALHKANLEQTAVLFPGIPGALPSQEQFLSSLPGVISKHFGCGPKSQKIIIIINSFFSLLSMWSFVPYNRKLILSSLPWQQSSFWLYGEQMSLCPNSVTDLLGFTTSERHTVLLYCNSLILNVHPPETRFQTMLNNNHTSSFSPCWETESSAQILANGINKWGETTQKNSNFKGNFQ